MADGIDEGVAYPLTSKRIKLNYLKHLAYSCCLLPEEPLSSLVTTTLLSAMILNNNNPNLQQFLVFIVANHMTSLHQIV